MPPFNPFADPDEEERQRELLAQQASPAAAPYASPIPRGDEPSLGAGAEPSPIDRAISDASPVDERQLPPDPSPKASADDSPSSPLEQLAQRYASQAMQSPQMSRRAAPQLPDVPLAPETPTWALVGGGLLDLALNKGRNAPRFLQAIANGGDATRYENYRRMAERAKTQSALDNAYAGGGRWNQAVDPMTMAARLQGLALSQKRLGLAGQREQRIDEQWTEMNDPNSATAKTYREAAVRGGIDPKTVDGLSATAVQKLFPTVNDYLKNTGAVGQARTDRAAATASAVSNATQPNKERLAGINANLRDAGAPEAMGGPIDWEAEHAAFAQHFPDGVVPVEWEQRFSALQKGPAKQIPMRLEQLYKDMGAGPPRAGAPKTAGEQSDLVAQFEAANPALVVVQPETYTRIASNPRTQTAVQQQLSTATRAIDASNRLQQIVAEYDRLSPADKVSGPGIALRDEYDKLKDEHQGIILKIAGSGGTGAEREEIKAGLPELSYLGAPNPVAGARLKGIARMLHLNVAANLAPYGLGVRGETEARPIAKKKAPYKPTDVPGRINYRGPVGSSGGGAKPLSKDEESALDKELF
ncbi:MAG TPA: hypothetical protein VHM19_22900 [Polyangiales bacterium]|jgi:hypothetical protein|nr:hypothetical protein [Polyangiales bacterium]